MLGVAIAACEPMIVAPPTQPPLPAGWSVIESDTGDLRLALPPDIVPFDTSGAIFANQPPTAPAEDWLEVLAEGPRTALPQPESGESLERWLELWFRDEPERGPTSTRALELPAGSAVELRTSVGAGTTHARAFVLYGIRTPVGVGFLVVDGPPSLMTPRDADVLLMATFIELGPGHGP